MTLVPLAQATPVAPHTAWSAWGGEPLILAGLVLASGCYARGVIAIWQRVGRGRVVTRWHAYAWAAGMLALLAALASPLEALAGTLFSAHMAQHALLTLVAGPLLALSAPVLPLLQGLPPRLRRHATRVHGRARRLRRLTRRAGWPFAAAAAYSGITWLWHLPDPYQAALRSQLLHAAEHLTLLTAAGLLWSAILASGRRSAFGYGTGIAVVFVTSLAHSALGAMLTFAPHVLYPHYAAAATAWGISPLDDQRLAGVVMWAPSKIVHGLAVMLLAIAWIRAAEARTQARQAAWASGK